MKGYGHMGPETIMKLGQKQIHAYYYTRITSCNVYFFYMFLEFLVCIIYTINNDHMMNLEEL